ncbi:MAG: hypothetical protein KC713_04545 [Candidatus Omnitrophica bacterium]|nr:hypothetical protein [Candidatus Omnitrophota bacterium]
MNEEEYKRRILLMYITKVSGHRQATLAIQRALKELSPGIEAPTVNGFGYTYPVLERVVNSAYMSVIKHTPKVWDSMYDNPKLVKGSQSIKKYLHKSSHEKIGRLIAKYNPDSIVCTQAFPCGMVADYKTSHHLDFRVIGVLTDFAPHSFWINEGVDYYIVPSIEAKERFIQKGINADRIKVYGIPIRSKFTVQLDRKPLIEKMGLDQNIPTILIMGGGQGLGPIKNIVQSLDGVKLPFQMVVLTGTNKKIYAKLKEISLNSNKKIIVHEFANNVDELMEVATMIITKPGGITTAESLAKGLPMVIVDPIPGQETRNTDFLIKKGIGIRIDDKSDIGEEIELLLKSHDRLAAMSKAAYQFSRPHASEDIAKLILNHQEEEQDLSDHDQLEDDEEIISDYA